MPEQRVFLKAHPAHPSEGIKSLCASIERHSDGLKLTYDLSGDLADLIVPAREAGIRRDELWKHTCFELFISDGGSAYFEYNFSPGGDWAAYQFSGYRVNGQDLDCTPPRISTSQTSDLLSVTVSLPELPDRLAPQPPQVGLTAVIENVQGQGSYWALDHIDEAPDFHRAETFTLTLD